MSAEEKLRRVAEAIATINKLHPLGDAIYDVRSRAVESGEPFDGNSWDHPKVKAYSDAVSVLQREGVIA